MTATRGTNDYTKDELLAADGLIQVLSQPITFNATDWAIAGDDYNQQSSDQSTEVTPDWPFKPDSRLTIMSSQPATVLRVQVSPKTWFHDLLERKPLRRFMRFGLRTPTLDGEGKRRIEAVLVVMVERSCVQEAVWYLEENKWSVSDAITQYRNDEQIRSNNNSEWYQDAVQRANTVTKDNFSAELLLYRIQEAAGKRRYEFSKAEEFDVENSIHLRTLNHWRADMRRVENDLPVIPDARGRDRNWKDGEERFLRNIYADKKNEYAVGRPPDMVQLVQELNAIIVGRYMPGKINPCAPRTVTSANAWLDRTWKRDVHGNRVIHQARYAAAIRVLNKRREEQVEYDLFVGATSETSLGH